MTWAVVVPTNRPERLDGFLAAWDPIFDQHNAHLIVVADMPQPPAVDAEVYSWADLDPFTPIRSDMIRSFGIWKAWQAGAEYTITLDDDVLPLGDTDPLAEYERVFRAGAPCSSYLDVGGLTSCGLQMRGFPYRDRAPAEVGVQYGGWSGVLDYDAATQLACPRADEAFAPVALAVPNGVPATGCIMNAAWRRDYTPLMWQLPLREGLYARFGDIWSGLFAKRVLDMVGSVMVINGRASVAHQRASDPFTNLVREAPGNPVNEGLWDALWHPQQGSLLERYVKVTDSAVKHFEGFDPDYARWFVAARDRWLALFV